MTSLAQLDAQILAASALYTVRMERLPRHATRRHAYCRKLLAAGIEAALMRAYQDLKPRQYAYRLSIQLHRFGLHKCSECGQVLEWTLENFYPVGSHKDDTCKSCAVQQACAAYERKKARRFTRAVRGNTP